MDEKQLPPGWYPDPDGGPTRKYWDGETWRGGVPDKRKPRGNAGRIVLALVVIALGIGIASAKHGENRHDDGGCGDLGPTCDATPKVDGMYRVAGEGFLDGGITPGWIATPGRRPDAKACHWERLSGPNVIDAGFATTVSDETFVRVLESDSFFRSEGCQPWVRIDHKG